jgi:Zn-dependent protease with chaperone function
VAKLLLLPGALLVFLLVAATVPRGLAQSKPAKQASTSGIAVLQADKIPSATITRYTLPPDRDQKARRLARLSLVLSPLRLIYGLLVLLFILRSQLAPRYRDIAERTASKPILQALIFAPLMFLTIDTLSLPLDILRYGIGRVYGLSVQSWPSWFADWLKGEFLNVSLAVLAVWFLYLIIRKSPRRWWLYFWLISLPVALALLFLEPLVIDPLFHKFEPLEQKDPALAAQLERMVRRSGKSIPPERMFAMSAGEKTTALNAYVSGIGASKRIVVWDTTIARMSTPQIVYVAGHEMGHYVLGHTAKNIAFYFALLFVSFYLAYRSIGAMLSRWGRRWKIRQLGDWASLPALLLLLGVLFTLATPLVSAFSRYEEHQADQYGLEVTHGLTADSGQVAAQAFQILGEVNLASPAPNSLFVLVFYDHPAIPDRVRFALDYDPWSHKQRPQFVE